MMDNCQFEAHLVSRENEDVSKRTPQACRGERCQAANDLMPIGLTVHTFQHSGANRENKARKMS